LRQSILQHQIPDAPTLEEFECLLGESPTNYPKGEAVEDIESELHSAAIDTDIYEKQAAEEAAHEKERSLRVETTNEVILQGYISPVISAIHCTRLNQL